MFAVATSGFARKKLAGSPAASAFARRVGSPSSPVVALVPAGVKGFGLYFASGFTKFVLAKFDEV